MVSRRIREWLLGNGTSRSLLSTISSSGIVEFVRPKIRDFVKNWFRGDTTRGFVERCFGVARRLKFAMPIILIKLGVIVTILGFLTIFALKSLGLLVTLFIFNTSALATKIAMWKNMALPYRQTQPQNVHFHIHPGKESPFVLAPTPSSELPFLTGYDKIISPDSTSSLLDDSSLIEKLALLQKYQQLGLYQPDALDDLSIIKQR